jgi:membrane protease YdiL (CAAX protease family)
MRIAVIPPSKQIAATAPREHARTREYIWASVLLASGVPEIVCHEFGVGVGLWLSLGELVLILILAMVAARVHPIKNLVGFMLAVAALKLGWDIVVPWIEASTFFKSIASHFEWSGRFFLSRALRLVGLVFLLLTLIGSNLTRRDLFMAVGNWRAPVQPEPFLPLRRPFSWAGFTVALLLVFDVVLPLFLYFTLHPDMDRAHVLIMVLPCAIATSAMNAANEEFQYRSVLLARLKNLVSPKEAALLTAVLFGVGHFFGEPTRWGGILMAGIAGWIWAKSMIETRGFACAFTSHFVQDMVIFGFLALSTPR